MLRKISVRNLLAQNVFAPALTDLLRGWWIFEKEKTGYDYYQMTWELSEVLDMYWIAIHFDIKLIINSNAEN